MPNSTPDPFIKLVLDDEEKAIELAINNGDYEDTSDFKSSKQLIEEAAKRHTELNTTKPVTLRLKQADIIKIKAKAKRNNIPYQTLLGALVHDFAEDKKELKVK